nr:alpha/beta hydrolase [Pseudofrankia saprophytica]
MNQSWRLERGDPGRAARRTARTGPVRGRLTGTLALLSLSVAGLAAPAQPAVAVSPTLVGVGRLSPWTACGDGAQCATLPVPLDYARPAAGTITLAVTRRPARDTARRIGSLVFLAGGPGQSGVDVMKSSSEWFDPPVRDRFDIVGFDQRGVGGSRPAVSCSSDQENATTQSSDAKGAPVRPSVSGSRADGEGHSSLDSTDPLADFRYAAKLASETAQQCKEYTPTLLPYLSTEAAARDVDLLRAALGDKKLTAFGSSYGTQLGATYAALFPTHIRALVLDAVVDAALSINQPLERLRVHTEGFEAALDAFLADCAHDPACHFGGGDPAGAYDRLMARLERRPIRAEGKDVDKSQPITADIARWGVIEALYSQQNWKILAQALQQADEDNNGAMLLSLASEGDDLSVYLGDDLSSGRRPGESSDNSNDAYIAIRCADGTYPTDLAAYQRFADRLRREAPRLGPTMAYGEMACARWPVHSASRYTGPFRAQGAPPILLVGTIGDPATPYSEARSLASQMASAVLLTWRSYTHGAYTGPSSCIYTAVDHYLLDLVPPRPGTVCS